MNVCTFEMFYHIAFLVQVLYKLKKHEAAVYILKDEYNKGKIRSMFWNYPVKLLLLWQNIYDIISFTIRRISAIVVYITYLQ